MNLKATSKQCTRNAAAGRSCTGLYRLLHLIQNCHRLQRLAIYEKHTDASKTFKVSFGPKLSLLLFGGSMLW